MTDLPTADVDPDDVPLDTLTVWPLGEDGESYIVEGTANPVLAEQAFVAWWNRTAGEYAGMAADEALEGLLPDSRVDWYWQEATYEEQDVHEVQRWLRAKSPAVDGRMWGSDGTEPEYSDQPLFRGVYFG